MSRTTLLLLLFGVAGAGCRGPLPRMHASQVLALAEQDPVRFHHEHHGKRVIVHGHVAAKHVLPRSQTRINAMMLDPVVFGTASEDTEYVPAVDLAPERRVMCYFPTSATEEVADVVVGQRIFLECRVSDTVQTPAGPVVRLIGCQPVDEGIEP